MNQSPRARRRKYRSSRQSLGKRSFPLLHETLENRRVLAVWINELHYDNAGGDVGEFVEVAGDAGTDLSGYRIELYNGSLMNVYDAFNLSGTIDNEGASGFGALAFDRTGVQNGGPDGLALIDPLGSVVEFLSYEGTITAVDGPANGLTSTDIGVAESTSTTQIGESLQRDNTTPGTPGAWRPPAPETPGMLNDAPPPPNDAPWLEAGADQAADANVAIQLDPALFADPDSTTHTITVDWGDGTVETIGQGDIAVSGAASGAVDRFDGAFDQPDWVFVGLDPTGPGALTDDTDVGFTNDQLTFVDIAPSNANDDLFGLGYLSTQNFSDVRIRSLVGTNAAGPDQTITLSARVNPAALTGYILSLSTDDPPLLEIIRFDGPASQVDPGGASQINLTPAIGYDATEPHILEMEVVGDVITGRIFQADGVTQIGVDVTWTDPENLYTSGSIGVTGAKGGAAFDGDPINTYFDNFSVASIQQITGSHAYTAGGDFDVTVSVADDSGNTTTDSFTVTVAPPPPTEAPWVDAGADQNANALAPIQLDPALFADPDSTTHTITVDWGDGTIESVGQGDIAVSGPASGLTESFDGAFDNNPWVFGDNDGSVPPSDTTIEFVNDQLHLVDNPGGGFDEFVVGFLPTENFSDVRVKALVGSDGSNDVTIAARVDAATGASGYLLSLGFDTFDLDLLRSDNGVLVDFNNSQVPGIEADLTGLIDPANQYYLELIIVDNFLTGRVFEADGVTQVGPDIHWLDDSAMAYTSGSVGMATAVSATNGNPINSYYDDFTAAAVEQITGSHTYATDGNFTATVSVTDDSNNTTTDSFTVTVAPPVQTPPTLTVATDQTLDEGDSLTNFELGTFTDINVGDTHTATIDWGDGTMTQAATVDQASDTISGDHTYADDGVFTATVTLSDGTDTVTDTFTVTVNNVSPTIALAGNATTSEGDSYTLNLGAVTDPGTDTVTSYVIDWGDGTSDTVDSAGGVTHTYADGDLNATISVDLVDEDGTHTDAGTLSVMVGNVVPTIALSGNASVDEGATYTLTLGAVTDPGDDTVTSYVVDWGDGTTDTIAAAGDVTHIYSDGDDNLTISVALVDEDGTHVDAGLQNVMINNVIPTIALSGNASVDEGSTYTLNLGAVTDPGNDTVTSYEIDWGDTTSDTVSAAGNVTHVYADGDDSPTITVNLVDEDGTHLAAGLLSLAVNNVPAIVNAGADQAVFTGDTLTLDPATFTDPGLVDTHLATVDWGDGSAIENLTVNQAASTASGSHTFASPGVYTVTVFVDDGEDLSTDTFTATVTDDTNLPPTVTAAADQSITEGTTLTGFTVATFSDPDSTTHTATIDWGDGSSVAVGTVDQANDIVRGGHTYADDGTYTVTVTVDDGRESTSAAFTVNVANVAPTVNITGLVSVNEGSPYNLTIGSLTDPGDDTVSQFVVDWGDGIVNSFTSTGTFSHVYDDGPDSAQITIDLVDEDGTYVDVDTLSVTINNVAPTPVITGPSSGQPGTPIEFDFSATEPSNDDAANITYEIDWENDGTIDVTQVGPASGITVANTFTTTGTFTIGLTTTDNDGGSDSTTDTLVIADTQNPIVVIDGVLIVTGTDSTDRIILTTDREPGIVDVRYNNTFFGPFRVSQIVVNALGGSDTVIANTTLPAELDGGPGNDYLAGAAADDLITGGPGNDVILTGEGDNVANGGDGNDRIDGRSGNDTFSGGTGSDRLNGNSGDDVLDGGSGNDLLNGGAGDDFIAGGSGIDTLNGYLGDDILLGGDDADQLFGRQGNDLIIGGTGVDRIQGGRDNDIVIGGETSYDANDAALRALLADWIAGGMGTVNAGTTPLTSGSVNGDLANDDLRGDSGVDWFFSDGLDRIRDFRSDDLFSPS